MAEYDDSRPTEFYDPGRQGNLGNPGPFGGYDLPGAENRTEVLRPSGPQIIAMLVGVDGPPGLIGQIFRIDPSHGCTIGREFNCDVVVDEAAVSKQHARIKLEKRENGDLQFFVQDLASENGTEVNNERVIKAYLTDNDRIKLGRAAFVFKEIKEEV